MADAQAVQAPDEVKPIRRIVVPVEGSDREYLVQEHAVLMAAALGVGIHAVHVRSGSEDRDDDMFAWLNKEAAQFDVDVDTAILDGEDPAEVLIEELAPLDLAIIGSARISGRFHISSVAERLVHDAPCPVQIIRLPA